MKQSVVSAIILGSLWLCSGCPSNDNWSYKYDIDKRFVTLLTEPEGAVVQQLNPMGQPPSHLGITPIQDQPVVVITKISKMKNMSYSQSETLLKLVGTVYVVIEKEGYQSWSGYLRTEADETLVHRITLQPASSD